jgi:homoserine dehydrogenase
MTTKKKKQIAIKTTKTGCPIKVALLGFGTVGSSVAQVLAASKFADVELTHIFNRNVERKRSSAAAKRVPASVVWTDNIDVVLRSDVDIVIELMGGLNPVEGWIRKALTAGKSVVTANKQLIAYRGASLARLAAQHNVHLVHGAAVAGGVPVIPGMLQGLGGDQVTRLSGIVNGTCNYILSRMEAGADYATVLADAQQLGYAESDPSADVDGFDARAKLCILSRIAMHAELDPDAVATQTISTIEAIDFSYAKELNCTIRQVSRAELDGRLVHARVAPMEDLAVMLCFPATVPAGSQRRWPSCRICWPLRRVVRRLSYPCEGERLRAIFWRRTISVSSSMTSLESSMRSPARCPRWARISILSCSGAVIRSTGCPLS